MRFPTGTQVRVLSTDRARELLADVSLYPNEYVGREGVIDSQFDVGMAYVRFTAPDRIPYIPEEALEEIRAELKVGDMVIIPNTPEAIAIIQNVAAPISMAGKAAEVTDIRDDHVYLEAGHSRFFLPKEIFNLSPVEPVKEPVPEDLSPLQLLHFRLSKVTPNKADTRQEIADWWSKRRSEVTYDSKSSAIHKSALSFLVAECAQARRLLTTEDLLVFDRLMEKAQAAFVTMSTKAPGTNRIIKSIRNSL